MGRAMMLFHLVTRGAWERALAEGRYRPVSLEREGFVHLSNERQWLASANRFFRGESDVVLLVLRKERLGPNVVYEAADGDAFPHLYDELNLDAVVQALAVPVAPDGSFEVPVLLATIAS